MKNSDEAGWQVTDRLGLGQAFQTDPAGRPMVTYPKFDTNGNTQVHALRLDKGVWSRKALTAWDHRWNFRGGGCIPMEIGFSALSKNAHSSRLQMTFTHVRFGSGEWIQDFDPETLQPVGEARPNKPWPDDVSRIQSTFPEMELHCMGSEPVVAGGRLRRWVLRWETLPLNRDQPRENYPPAGPLEVIQWRKGARNEKHRHVGNASIRRFRL